MSPYSEDRPGENPDRAKKDDLLRLREGRDAAVHAAREAVRDTTRLTRLLTILNDPDPFDRLLDRILSTLSELFLADIVVLLDPVGTGSFVPLAAVGLSEDMMPLPFSDAKDGYVPRLMQTGTPMLTESVQDVPDIEVQLRDMGAQTMVGLPVDGGLTTRGALILARCSPTPFTRSEAGQLKAMAYRIGLTLIEAQRSVQFEKLVQSGREISRYLDTASVSSEAVSMFPAIVSADAAALFLTDPNGELSCTAQAGLSASCTAAMGRLAGHLMASSPLAQGEPYSSADLTTLLAHCLLEPAGLAPVKALLATPIHRKDVIQGVLFAVRFSAIAFDPSALQIAMLYAEQISAAIENASLYQAVHKELSERERLEAEQRKWERQRQQLQKANSLNSMAGAIAHHFNNQLAVVMGNLELALDVKPLAPDIADLLEAAMQGAFKAAEVSNSMLTYLGQTTGIHVPMDLSEVCRQSLPLLQTAAPKGLVIDADFPFPGPVISANENQIQQVLTNLITNAWEAVEKHDGTISLAIKWVSSETICDSNRFPVDWRPQDLTYACLEVADGGSGIAEEDIEKLFDPFFSSKFTGRGLGLPMALGIVKNHGGVITVESAKGTGSIFRVYLPISEGEVHRSPQKANPFKANAERSFRKAVSYRADDGGLTVLLVEDEENVRRTAAAMLGRLGYRVLAAEDGLAALEVFRGAPDDICLVVCDLTMPRMNGWETVSALRLIRPDIPVVLASGHDESQVMSGDHPDIPYQAFLHKPYQKAALKDALSKAMTVSQPHQ